MSRNEDPAFWSAVDRHVLRYGGSFDRKIDLPVHNPTCPMFGGDDLDIIYVTSALEELSAAQLAEKPLAGNIHAVTSCGVRGLPAHLFAG